MIGRYVVRSVLLYAFVLFLPLYLGACGRAFLMSHEKRLPASPNGISIRSAAEWRQVLYTLHKEEHSWRGRSEEDVLAYLEITSETRNISWVRTPRAKQEIYMSPNIRVDNLPASEIGYIYKTLLKEPERVDILVIPPMDIQETMLPNIRRVGANFWITGENFSAYIVFLDNMFFNVMPAENQPINTEIQSTILDLIPSVAQSAASQGTKSAIP